MSNKLPFMKFFTADWLKQTRGFSFEEKGIWIDLLAYMWESDDRGRITTTWPNLSRMLGGEWLNVETKINQMKESGILEVVTNPNLKVTISCRRMMREENVRESNRLKQRRFKKRAYNQEVTIEKSEVRSQKTDKDISAEPEIPCLRATPFLTFQTNGKVREWVLTNERILELNGLYPGVDIELEMRKASDWCTNNPMKRKTVSGMNRFITTWLARQQNSGGGKFQKEESKSSLPYV